MNSIRGSGKILVLEDEVEIKKGLVTALRNEGYTCDIPNDVNGVLTKLQEGPQRYSVIITDIGMSELNGIEFISRVKQIGYEGKILVHSGHNINDLEIPDKSNITFCQKPMKIGEILRILREM